MPYLLAIDQGTTSSRAIVFDHDGVIRAAAQKEFRQIFPQTGWVEHDPEEIWASQINVAAEALDRAGLTSRDIAGLGITNQRETTLIWDRDTGEPIHNAIVWQDRRTAGFCEQLKADGAAALVHERTGLLIDPYFSASKIRWLLDNVPDARRRAESGKLAFGTIDTWLIWKLTGGRQHVTDVTNASRTMVFNIHNLTWDDELLDLLGIPSSLLPEVRSSSEVYGEVSESIALRGAPIAGVAGDQQAALFGQLCLTPGMSKNTYGTGCFLLQNVGAKPRLSTHRLVSTVAWQIDGNTQYALEGSVFIGGAVVQWIRDGLGLIESAAEIEPLAKSVPDSGDIFLVPAFAGLGAPHWDPYARGTIVGITRGTTSAHFARAALESIAFQVADLLDAMSADAGVAANELRADGGAAANNLLMQIQADLLGIPVIRPAITETTALGAAYLAGLAVGFWDSVDDVSGHWRIGRRFEPTMSRHQANTLRAGWSAAIDRARSWVSER